MKKAHPESQTLKFEDALKRLEKIVEKLEGGEAALEESLALYEEGISLFRLCSSKLEEAKKKIEILNKDGGTGKIKPAALSMSVSSVEIEDAEEEIPF